ncbi:hypothetical protein SAY86_001968 [Trapa natans]|uniref:Exocyst subunit Exo70 family protein n=1 Tax=Trapa natans TaxID=22666 RepID=A0AAN7LJG8_TRANT|nr:hypothetical protein SAY86_001968 [Trapa natans]
MKSPDLSSRPFTPSRSPMRYTPPSTPMQNSLSDSLVDENVDIAEALISLWEPDVSVSDHHLSRPAAASLSFKDNRYQAKQFLNSIKSLQSAMHYYIKHDSASASHQLVRAQNLMQTAMRRLEKEFYAILSTNRRYLDHESISSRSSRASTMSTSSVSDNEYESEEEEFRFAGADGFSPPCVHESEVDRASSVVMADLKAIADCMIATGYGKECVKIYKMVRKSIVDEALYNMGVDLSFNLSEIQKMEWKALEVKIRGWLRAVKVSVRTIFFGERILCDRVFSSSIPIRQSCFNEITRNGALALFAFPETVAKRRRLSAEKLFLTLDMYEAIANLWPEIESIFSDESAFAVRSQAVSSLVRLGDAARSMLADLESAIEKDSSKTPVAGAVHPLTRYVMNYLAFAGDYTEVLSDIVADWPEKGHAQLPESYFSFEQESYSSAMAARIAWVVLILMCKIDGKAKLYKDVELSYLFLANNLHYVVSKVRQSRLMELLGFDWVAQHESRVRQYVESYTRIGWGRAIESLPPPDAGNLQADGARECFRRFNLEFQAAYRKQLEWAVADSKMREEIKAALSGKLLPTYTALYEAHGVGLRRDAFRDSIVRMSPEELRNYLSDLFQGNGGSGSVSSSSHSRS